GRVGAIPRRRPLPGCVPAGVVHARDLGHGRAGIEPRYELLVLTLVAGTLVLSQLHEVLEVAVCVATGIVQVTVPEKEGVAYAVLRVGIGDRAARHGPGRALRLVAGHVVQ